MRTLSISFAVILLFSCTERPAPTIQAVNPADRPAIAIQYVGVNQMNVYPTPDANAAVTTVYRFAETVSILSYQGDWAQVRTVGGMGWVPRRDLLAADAIVQLIDNQIPRFSTPPVEIPAPRARGEMVFHAKVNTDGEIIEVKTVKNTSGNDQLALQNASALLQARFYPMVQKGQRYTFTYEHKVTY